MRLLLGVGILQGKVVASEYVRKSASTGKFPTNGTHQGDVQFSLSLSGQRATHTTQFKHEGKSLKLTSI